MMKVSQLSGKVRIFLENREEMHAMWHRLYIGSRELMHYSTRANFSVLEQVETKMFEVYDNVMGDVRKYYREPKAVKLNKNRDGQTICPVCNGIGEEECELCGGSGLVTFE